MWAGVANAISFLANGCGRISVPCDVHQALAIIGLYRKQLDFTIENRSNEHGIRTVPFIGGIAFAMAAEPKLADFYLQVVSGENLVKTMPAYLLRKYLTGIGSIRRSGHPRLVTTQIIMQAAYHFVTGASTKLLKATENGTIYFAQRQKANVRKVLEIIAGS